MDVVIHQGLDLQGGLQVVLEARPAPGQEVDRDVLNGTRDTLERRVSGLGVSEPLIQTRGSNQIVVELPGVEDPQAAVNLLRETALLEIIDPQGQSLPIGQKVNTTLGPAESVNPSGTATPETTRPADGTPEASVTPETTPSPSPTPAGPTYTTIVSGSDIEDAFPTTDQFGTLVVGFRLKDEASAKFFEYTSTTCGQPMSIVLDKEVINTATIQAGISREGIISGLNAEEVGDLSIQIKSGALEVPLEVVQSRTVGPTLGQDSIDQSIVAGIIGITLVALLMILYYRLPGVLSVVALLFYSAIVMAFSSSSPSR